MVRRELNRRTLDCTALDVRVSHGVVTLRGVVKPMRGGSGDPRGDIEIVCRTLRSRGVRDIVTDIIYRT